jgi:ABC-2 type transport system ATP-binding protein
MKKHTKVQKPALTVDKLFVNRKTFKLEIEKLEILPGEITCIVGANGSGKTTLLETIAGLIKPTSGVIKIKNKVVDYSNSSSKKVIGYIPDDDGWIIPELTPSEYFTHLKKIYKLNRSVEKLTSSLCKKLLFTDTRRITGGLSHGNKKKVQIISGIMHEPSILIVDEMRNGLDPLAIMASEKLLLDQRDSGVTIIAATHDLWWAERISNNIVMLSAGKIILQDTVKNIVKTHGSLENCFLELVNAK